MKFAGLNIETGKNEVFGTSKSEILTDFEGSSIPTTNSREPHVKTSYLSSRNKFADFKKEIRVNLSSKGNKIALKVGDNGIGLPKGKNLENNGTLGFLIINTLVNQIHGKIKMFNKKGTTFEIKFPFNP
jgi:signal transduction histidine kinase